MYDVVALQNQTVEVIRSKLRVGDWQLQPGLVERIYETVGEESNLRWLISVALGSINEPGDGVLWPTFVGHYNGSYQGLA